MKKAAPAQTSASDWPSVLVLFSVPLLGAALRVVGMVEVDRTADRDAIGQSGCAGTAGLVFPEALRTEMWTAGSGLKDAPSVTTRRSA